MGQSGKTGDTSPVSSVVRAQKKKSKKEKKEKKDKKEKKSKKEKCDQESIPAASSEKKKERKRKAISDDKGHALEPVDKLRKVDSSSAVVEDATVSTGGVDAQKATKKLTKKLGRAPSANEIKAYIARKVAKKQPTGLTDGEAEREPAKAAIMKATESNTDEKPKDWIDSVGDPPRKGQIPDGKGGWRWPIRATPTGDNSILLFYGYVTPVWSKKEQDEAIDFAYGSLSKHGCSGRLRVAREGFNGTLGGPHHSIRAFTKDLSAWCPEHFGNTDFKFVDNLPDNQMFKELKVFPVSELVTYGFPTQASITNGGKHLKPADYHKAMDDPNAVMIDVRNFNESLIGKFAPPNVPVLDPGMRKSTEFPKWVDNNLEKLKGKKVLMYCTGGIRCERASSYLVEKGLKDVNQLEGGIHRYLEAYNDDGGYWIGKNYTFDKRFSHGANKCEIISTCVLCSEPWERYNAQKKCKWCRMEVLVCRNCVRKSQAKGPEKVPIDKEKLVCPLCVGRKGRTYGPNTYGPSNRHYNGAKSAAKW